LQSNLKIQQMDQRFISFEVIEKFMTGILTKAGIPADDAVIIGDAE